MRSNTPENSANRSLITSRNSISASRRTHLSNAATATSKEEEEEEEAIVKEATVAAMDLTEELNLPQLPPQPLLVPQELAVQPTTPLNTPNTTVVKIPTLRMEATRIM